MRSAVAVVLVLATGGSSFADPSNSAIPRHENAALGHGLALQFYVSVAPGPTVKPANILIAIHGYPRDVLRTFDAASFAAANAGHGQDTLIVAPVFQVPRTEAARCDFHGTIAARPGDAVWDCDSWSNGSQALNGPVTSFAAIDTLVQTLRTDYPSVHRITIAGFSAGAQFVQHYVGFAKQPTGSMEVRYVVADPSAWLYFDRYRPVPNPTGCPGFNHWKFGTDQLPSSVNRNPAAARSVYADADIAYLAAAHDTGRGRGTSYKLLEKGCEAETQGAYRLDRGQAYATYDNSMLADGRHTLTIVPDCAHAVMCVFPSPSGREALFADTLASSKRYVPTNRTNSE